MSTPVYDIDVQYETELYDYNNFAFIYDGAFGYQEPGVEYGGDESQSSTTSTLNQELNRLANGGTYRPASQMVDMGLAARQWATLRGISSEKLDIVGTINLIAGNTRPRWKDMAGVCNQIAGTSGLDPVGALREVAS